ncbi:hypothetical protein ACFYNV_29210 [Streptomyces albidoflavus]
MTPPVDVLPLVVAVVVAFPVWGPFLAVLAALLLVQAVRGSYPSGGDTEGTPVPSVPAGGGAAGDAVGDAAGVERVACGDSVPRGSGTGVS